MNKLRKARYWITLGMAAAATAGRPAFGQQSALEEMPPAAELQLAKQVRHELLMLPYYGVFDDLSYRVQGSTVTLTGQVTRPTLKSDAANVVRRIRGAEQVVNQIEVLPLSPADDQIRRAVYRTLFAQNSPLFRYGAGTSSSVRILVKNGNVTLAGYVATEFDRTVANIRSNSVPGVFSVTNRLQVVKS